ncbi:MAG: hypothetical protein OHK0022_26050 [Roseiflexaceae bacterium]
MTASTERSGGLWTRLTGRMWYLWGSSLCYWGIRTSDLSFYRGGIDAFTRAIDARPDFALAYYRRGLIRGRELSEHSEGIADLSTAIALAPEWAEPYLQRGLLQRFHGDQGAALDDLRQYLELGGTAYWRAEAERQIAAILGEQ